MYLTIPDQVFSAESLTSRSDLSSQSSEVSDSYMPGDFGRTAVVAVTSSSELTASMVAATALVLGLATAFPLFAARAMAH